MREQRSKESGRPRIGLLPTGHFYYWDQFPGLKEKGQNMYGKLMDKLSTIGDVIAPDLVDTIDKAVEASKFFQDKDIDILIIFPFGYTPGMCIVPVVKNINVPIRILNAHEDSSYNYKESDTAEYLHHEGVCCIPEYAGAIVNLGKTFRVRTGHFDSQRLWEEILADCKGAAAARMLKSINIGLIGQTYTGMTDMAIDEHRLLRATGKLLVRPEVEEIEEAYKQVTQEELEGMYAEFRAMYDVDSTVTDDHMKESAKIAIAFHKVIHKYDIHAFGFYWWGLKESITELRSQAALGVSRLAALGRPGVTEGDVKTAIAMKIFDLLGEGISGIFMEFFAMDFDNNFILMGHDGPSNITVSEGKPRLQHLTIHHGKSGHGLGIDFQIPKGPVTILNLIQSPGETTFKLMYTIGQVIPGDILEIGNPNCRVSVSRPIHEFMDAWCQEGPTHHIALGIGNHSNEIEALGEAMEFKVVRI